MQLKQTVRKAKNIDTDMIIGIDEFSKPNNKLKRVWRKVQHIVNDKMRNVRYLIVRNGSGNLEFLKRNINAIVPVKVHPNTKEHKAVK